MAPFASLPLSIVDSRPPATDLSQQRRLASTPATSSPLPTTADELLYYLGMKFEPSPPLPLKITGFNFLTSVDLSGVRRKLEEIPFSSGWKLVEYNSSRVETGDEPGWETGAGWDVNIGDGREKLEEENEQSPIHLDRRPFQPWSATGWDEDLNIPGFDLNESQTESDPDLQTGSEPVLEEISPEPVTNPTDSASPPAISEPTSTQSSRKRRLKLPAGCSSPPSTQHIQFLDFDYSVFPPVPKKVASEKQKPPSKSPEEPIKKTTQPIRKSTRIASQTRAPSSKQSTTPIEVDDSSFESTASSLEEVNPEVSSASTDSSSPTPSPASTVGRKRKSAPKQGTKQGPAQKTSAGPPPKRAKKSHTPNPKLTKFLQRSIVKGKIVDVEYFQAQGLAIFLEKLRAQGWLTLFGNSQVGCSAPDVAEFYANCSVTQGVVTSEVGGVLIRFDEVQLGEILGVPPVGCAAYIREDKEVLDQDQLLDLDRRLGQQPGLARAKSLKKGEMAPLHQFLFWFVIKSIIPRGQGRNLADPMDQHLVDLLDRGKLINLPGIMIRHIHRIATSTRDHDLGYGFFLTRVLEEFGVSLQRRLGAQKVDIIGSPTLLACGIKPGTGGASVPEQGLQTPFTPVSGSSSSTPPVDLLQELTRQKTELEQVKVALDEEKALQAKRHEDILSLLSSLTARLPNLTPPPP